MVRELTHPASTSDLITKIHQDLVRRIWALHKDVLAVKKNLATFIELYYPDVASKIEQQLDQELLSVQIPDSLSGRLERMLERRQGRWMDRPPTLPEMADLFLIHLGRSTVR